MPLRLLVLWPLFGRRARGRRKVEVILTPPKGETAIAIGRGLYVCSVIPAPRTNRDLRIDITVRNDPVGFAWNGKADLSDHPTWIAGELRPVHAGEYVLSWSFDRQRVLDAVIGAFVLSLEPLAECPVCGRTTRAGRERCPECKSPLPAEPPGND